jgi:hypothetical protein
MLQTGSALRCSPDTFQSAHSHGYLEIIPVLLPAHKRALSAEDEGTSRNKNW